MLASAFGAGAIAGFATLGLWGSLAGVVSLLGAIGAALRLYRDVLTRRRDRVIRRHRRAA